MRLIAAVALALAAGALAIALGASAAWPDLPDADLGIAAGAFGVAVILASVALRPLRSQVLPVFGAVLGAIVVLYASALLDPTPTADPERANVLFGLCLVGLWSFPMAARLLPGQWWGVAGSLLLLVGIAVAIALVDRFSAAALAPVLAVAATGTGLLAIWALRIAADPRRGAQDAPDEVVRPARVPPGLSWRWGEPLPIGITRTLTVTGIAAIAGAAIRLVADARAIEIAPLEASEVVFGLGYALVLFWIVRAAPKVGEVTALPLRLVDLAFPVGLLAPALIGGIAVAAVGAGTTDRSIGPIGVTSAGFVLIGLSSARLAWILRGGPRRLGIAAGLVMAVGGFVGARADARGPVPTDPVEIAGLVVAAAGWAGCGIWLIRLAGWLRGQRPVDAFAIPNGSVATIGPRPVAPVRQPRRRPVAGRELGRRIVRYPKKPRPKPRFGADELARRLGLGAAELRAARPAYRTFAIPKRSGGVREIAAPDDATKALQRRILQRLLARLPAHDAAHGFERGRSIVTNANRHAAPAVLVKLDIESFFGSTRAQRVRRYWRVLGWDREAARILTALTTLDGGLPQGAPTSPRLANLVNVRLDARLTGLATSRGATYTRYADDLTFSFASDDGAAVRGLIHLARWICHDEGRYRLHLQRKVEIRRRHERQTVTGLVVNDGPPRIGRARRRWLRAVEHRRYSGGRPTIDDAALHGWQALEAMVETQAEDGRRPPTLTPGPGAR